MKVNVPGQCAWEMCLMCPGNVPGQCVRAICPGNVQQQQGTTGYSQTLIQFMFSNRKTMIVLVTSHWLNALVTSHWLNALAAHYSSSFPNGRGGQIPNLGNIPPPPHFHLLRSFLTLYILFITECTCSNIFLGKNFFRG